MSTASTATITANLNGSSTTFTLGIQPLTVTTGLTCSPSGLLSGGASSCTVTLNYAAPTNGTVVAVADNSPLLTTPASVTVASGSRTAAFTVTASVVNTASTAIISASLNGSSSTYSLGLLSPTVPTGLSCNPTSLVSGGTSTCTITLNNAAQTGGTVVALSDNTALLTTPASVTIPASALTASFNVTAGTISTAQTAVVTATVNGVSKTASVALTVASATCPCSVWKPTAAPNVPTSSDTAGVELGLRFQSKLAGYVTGVRFYKGANNSGTHTGHLWTNGGKLLASVTFSGETSSGWQQANFSTPVAVTANTTYIISYWAPAGHYPFDTGYFSASSVTNGPLVALQSNDVYIYSKASFPASIWYSTNYWVDVVFNTVPSTTPTVIAASVSDPVNAKTAMSVQSASASSAHSSAVASTRARSLSCAPSAVHAGDSFTCELRLAEPSASRSSSSVTTIAVASNSSDVRLPASISARAGQSSIKFRGTIDNAAPQSVVTISTGEPGNQTEDQIAVQAAPGPVFTLPTTLLVKAGEPISFRVAAQDPAGLPVQVSASNLPAGASFQPTSGRFDWTPALNQQGAFAPLFSALNSAGTTSSATSEITVGSGNPVLAQASRLACSPGAIASLTGHWLSVSDEDLSNPAGSSKQLGGTLVHVNGELAPVLYSSPTRVEFQCPNAAAGTGLDVTLETRTADATTGTTATLHTTMLEANPVLLLSQSSNPDQGQITLSGTEQLAATRDVNTGGEPAQIADLVSIRATGLGAAVSTASISVKLGGVDAQVQSVTPAPDAAGVYLITVRIPAAAPIGDAVPVQLEMISSTGHHLSSNKVTLAIE